MLRTGKTKRDRSWDALGDNMPVAVMAVAEGLVTSGEEGDVGEEGSPRSVCTVMSRRLIDGDWESLEGASGSPLATLLILVSCPEEVVSSC